MSAVLGKNTLPPPRLQQVLKHSVSFHSKVSTFIVTYSFSWCKRCLFRTSTVNFFLSLLSKEIRMFFVSKSVTSCVTTGSKSRNVDKQYVVPRYTDTKYVAPRYTDTMYVTLSYTNYFASRYMDSNCVFRIKSPSVTYGTNTSNTILPTWSVSYLKQNWPH